jgi:membrane associated rhomboid family serine protease
LNFIMGSIAIKLSSVIFNKVTIGEFFLFLIFSTVAAEYFTFPNPVEGFVGVSGGIFGLLGWMVAYSARNSGAFPQRFWLSLLCFSSLNLLASSASSENSSHVAHLTGFTLGLVLGLRQSNN